MSDEKYPPLVITLVNVAETNWIMEGTEPGNKAGAPARRMSWPGQFRIPPTSKYKVELPEGGYKLVPIRFIMGCDTLDPEEQEKKKWVPNIEQDNIWISNGTLTVLREGSTLMMYDYLKLFEGNINNPKRPPEAENVFMEVVAIEVAKINNVSFDKKAAAYRVLSDIRQPVGEDDNATFTYDLEKLAIMSTLFNLNHLDSPEEKFMELYQIAEEKPDLIVDSIMNGKKKLFALIKKADDLSVLGLTEERAYFTATNTVILAFKGKPAKNNQVNKLADFLLTDEGKPFLQQLNQSVETASSKSLERIKV